MVLHLWNGMLYRLNQDEVASTKAHDIVCTEEELAEEVGGLRVEGVAYC